ncbi:phenazine biosynthesis protein PhzF family [Microbulbifer donghaiensis]|uniref:Phenazine biosynthesis protein PhzF family n=1 Tax=Microbulbifer donghaiensis TaxID=494016 RepID=A0A1M5F8H6_9GAMM|nr:PhzF family phenazine biosynthesis protein [Microbulbifer donghaiensis]SHF87371.1 phenazine biosynthesis protein PhzF family [Microbulbifer donghaiensis]
MQLPIYQADAFTSILFAGNPAALVPLQQWLADDLLQSIAAENNLAETAFTVPATDGFELRWFTPAAEVPLCGHATLASAHLLWTELGYQSEMIRFFTRSGELRVRRAGDLIQMDFPAQPPAALPLGPEYRAALGAEPQRALAAAGNRDMVVLEFADAAQVAALQPDFRAVAALPYRGVICTAAGGDFDCDFVSRFFAPAIGIDEDPVTGSAHTLLTPFWATELDKTCLRARQISARGGELECELVGERVLMRGRAVTYLRGQITL